AIETAHRIAELPQAEDEFRSGGLTPAQAAEIASAGAVAPHKEGELLEVARTEGLAGLKKACRRVVAAAIPDEAERAERLHRSRYLRSWTDPEGAFRLDARLTPEAGGEVRAALDSITEDLFSEARRQGRKEPHQALEADALVEMARSCRREGRSEGPRAVANVRVDHAALIRGYPQGGEVCEVAGVGPIPVAAAKAMMADSILNVVVCKGAEVQTVAHHGRTISARMRAALCERYPQCAVQGCHESKRLEIDHVVPLSRDGARRLDNLVRLCSHHHRMKTYRGFHLERDRDRWRLTPPQGAPARASP
ncbi:MAG: HNH endonuclease, partial [Acidimicrobiia bacterium]